MTYAWGWLVYVSEGPMDTQRYTRYYLRELKDQIEYLFEEAERSIAVVKNPLPRLREVRLE